MDKTKSKKLQKPKTKKTYKKIHKNNEYLDIIKSYYTFQNPINFSILRYIGKDKSELSLIGNYKYSASKSYTFSTSINKKYKELVENLNDLKITDLPYEVRYSAGEFTRTLTSYLQNKFSHLPKSPSNGFTKLWEIYNTFEFLISRKSPNFKILHICEAPGQWVIATQYFISKKRRNIKHHDWRANSLNPYNAENLEKYGNKDIIGDTYDMIKNNYGKWLWGADNTGDITRSSNVRWFRNYCRKWAGSENINIVAGDGGLGTHNDLVILSKIDLGQLIMVSACSSIGGHCIIKHFTPYMFQFPITKKLYDFFISYIYVYSLLFENVNLFKPYTSNPDSGEFYVIGRNFQGCSDAILEQLLAVQENYKLFDSIFPVAKIPDSFKLQINTFIDSMSKLNNMNMEKQVMLVKCINKSLVNKDICDTYLDIKSVKNINKPKFEKWIDIFNFE